MNIEMCWTLTRPPEPSNRWILGFGSNIAGHIDGMWSLMRFDGNWWNEDGTELCDVAPDFWGYLPDDESIQIIVNNNKRLSPDK